MENMIVVPGLGGSGRGHWQSYWLRERRGAVRVEQRDWERPDRDEWVAELHDTVQRATGPVVLVAHSLGCHTVAHWAHRHDAKVRAALLVAPPDIDYSAAHGAPLAASVTLPPGEPTVRFVLNSYADDIKEVLRQGSGRATEVVAVLRAVRERRTHPVRATIRGHSHQPLSPNQAASEIAALWRSDTTTPAATTSRTTSASWPLRRIPIDVARSSRSH